MRLLLPICFLLCGAINAQTLDVVAMGQSNMISMGIGGPSPMTASARVKVWNNGTNLASDGDSFISPPDFGNAPWHPSGSNNLAIWFADAAAENLGIDVNLVVVAKGAQSITQWRPANPMYMATKRIYQLTGRPPAQVLLWHQGETDKNMAPCAYQIELMNLIENLRADGIIAQDAYILVGELRYAAAAAISSALYGLAMMRADIGWVSANGIWDYDDIHFTGSSIKSFGVRYYEKYKLFLNQGL